LNFKKSAISEVTLKITPGRSWCMSVWIYIGPVY